MADVAETIEESGRRIGHHAWIEMRLFETLGRWSGTVPEPRAKALLASQSYHHAWHAELWHGLLPAIPHMPAADLVAPDETGAQIVASLASFDEEAEGHEDGDGHGSTVARLTALYEVALPHLVDTYTDHLEHTTIVTDGPTARVLRLALNDLADDLVAGDDMIDALRSVPTTGAPS
jgi:hypothetical protein